VLVYLSRVTSAAYPADSSVLLSPDSTTAARSQRKIWISIGTLMLLRVGDIWRNGVLVDQPNYQLDVFSELRIDKSTTNLIKAGLNLNEQGFLLPIAEHPWHLQCTHTYCVMVRLDHDRRLIIPCMELARFYFGSSSGLITSLFLPPLQKPTLYSNANFEKINGFLEIELGENISGASAADIGRLHLNQVAWRSAVQIGTSMIAGSVSDKGIHPQTHFPFEGNTTLIAKGKWLSFSTAQESTFLVYSLQSCSHPFPFKSLKYTYKNCSKRNIKTSQPNQTPSSQSQKKSAKDSLEQDVVDQDASNNLISKIKNIKSEPRFPDLTKKSVWKNQDLSASNSSDITSSGTPINQTAVGKSGSSERIRSIDLAFQLNSKQSHQMPDFLRNSVNELMQLQNLKIELLTASDEDGWTVPATTLSDEDGEIDLRLYMEDDLGELRLRRVSAFAIKKEDEHVSVVLIESVPIYIKLYTTAGDNTNEIFQTLMCASGDYLSKSNSSESNLLSTINWLFDSDEERRMS